MFSQALFRFSKGAIASTRSFSTSNVSLKHVSLIGVPFSGGQPKGGVDLGPGLLRDGNIKATIEDLGWEVVDLGDAEIPPENEFKADNFERVRKPNWVGAVSQNLSDMVYNEAKTGKFPLIMGGDHSIAVGSVSGVARAHPDVGVIWVDAHADINTTGSTPSGNLHGMPLSFLLGLSSKDCPGFNWITSQPALLKRDQLVYIGLRDLDIGEKKFLKEHHIKAFDMHDVDKYGIGQVMDMAKKILGERPVHLSFDIDSLDPTEAPTTGTPVRGGLSFREGAYLCEYIQKNMNLVSMELVEINPKLGTQEEVDLTVKTGLSMIRCALGETLT